MKDEEEGSEDKKRGHGRKRKGETSYNNVFLLLSSLENRCTLSFSSSCESLCTTPWLIVSVCLHVVYAALD